MHAFGRFKATCNAFKIHMNECVFWDCSASYRKTKFLDKLDQMIKLLPYITSLITVK